jgi:hypothetical protein
MCSGPSRRTNSISICDEPEEMFWIYDDRVNSCEKWMSSGGNDEGRRNSAKISILGLYSRDHVIIVYSFPLFAGRVIHRVEFSIDPGGKVITHGIIIAAPDARSLSIRMDRWDVFRRDARVFQGCS